MLRRTVGHLHETKCFAVFSKCFVVFSKYLVVFSKYLVVFSKYYLVLGNCLAVLSGTAGVQLVYSLPGQPYTRLSAKDERLTGAGV